MWCHPHLRLGHCALHHAQEMLPRARKSPRDRHSGKAGQLEAKGILQPGLPGCTGQIQTRMWVKTLNPSWSDPSPYHNLRALKVPTLRASLGITGPPLTGFPLPCHLGNCGMDYPPRRNFWQRTNNLRIDMGCGMGWRCVWSCNQCVHQRPQSCNLLSKTRQMRLIGTANVN